MLFFFLMLMLLGALLDEIERRHEREIENLRQALEERKGSKTAILIKIDGTMSNCTNNFVFVWNVDSNTVKNNPDIHV